MRSGDRAGCPCAVWRCVNVCHQPRCVTSPSRRRPHAALSARGRSETQARGGGWPSRSPDRATQHSVPITSAPSVHIHSKDTPPVTDTVAMSCPVPLLRDSSRSLHGEEELGEVSPPSLLPAGARREGRRAETCLPWGTGLLEASWQPHLPPLD